MGRGSLGPPRCLCFQELLSLGLWKGRGEGIGPLELQVECVCGGGVGVGRVSAALQNCTLGRCGVVTFPWPAAAQGETKLAGGCSINVLKGPKAIK